MKLISMTEFVLDTKQKLEIGKDFVEVVCNYASFLIQPLTLGMFVPCDEDGNVLEDPCKKNSYCADFCQGRCQENYNESIDYIFFYNYSVKKQKDYYIVSDSHGRNVWLSWNKSKTIESLVNEITEVTLTPNAIKQLKL